MSHQSDTDAHRIIPRRDEPAAIRVLLVDDDPAIAALVAEVLPTHDPRFEATVETDPARALERLHEGSLEVDCIVSDYDMPRLDGLEFLQGVRSRFAELPFILYTGKGSEEIASEAISAGVTDYLRKAGGTSQYTILANRILNAIETQRAQRRAQKRRRRLEVLIENLPGIVYQCRNEEGWPMVSLEGDWEAITGYSKAEFETDVVEFGALVHPDDRARVWHNVQQAIERETSYTHTFRIHTATNEVRWVWERGQGLQNEDGERDVLEGFITDVTDRERDKRELEHAKQRLELALAEADAGIWEWTVDAGELYWSDELLDLLGMTRDEFGGTIEELNDRLHPDDRERVSQAIEDALANAGSYQIRQRLKHTNGEFVPFDVRGQVVQQADSTTMVGIAITLNHAGELFDSPT